MKNLFANFWRTILIAPEAAIKMVDFCDACGAIIVGKKGTDVECPSCGKISKAKSSVKMSEKVEKKEEAEIVDTGDSPEIHPTTKIDCEKCGNTQAYHWSKQMRAADEPETEFYKCTECGHTWRNYN